MARPHGVLEGHRVGSQGYREFTPFEICMPSRGRQIDPRIVRRALRIIRRSGGISKRGLLRELGLLTEHNPGNAIISIMNADRSCYLGDAKLDPKEHTGWIYYDRSVS